MNTVTMAMHQTILNNLSRIEQQHNVTILWACELCSRAWGFASPAATMTCALFMPTNLGLYSVFDKRDVIEEPINGLLDINGWDIKKALGYCVNLILP
ncbi:MAG: nucleotidyltransferase domain-containing protein [Moraxellaceae bacterium]|nr:nucleotidyltransferase domain-containing protein [Moraxellaceae bacterium]